MKKALVVDDIEDNITLLSFELEDDGFEVISAQSGQKCIELAAQEPRPDIILLDINMPGLSGIETLERLKSSDATTDIPVIMVSASDTNDIIIQAIDLGAHDFVSKPIEYPVLAARMRSALRLSSVLAELEQANAELNTLATTDPLTGCYNRRHFFTLANNEASKSLRHQRPLSLMMMDVDHFKTINDTYGHAAGDLALKNITNSLRQACRNYDILGRIGGEEFALCCPYADIDSAYMIAERIRKNCQALDIEANGGTFKTTISIGVTELSNGEKFEDALNRADGLLYYAKNTGRNRTISSTTPLSLNEDTKTLT